MALNDLFLNIESGWDHQTQQTVVNAVLKSLGDQNGQVQNLCIKSLSSLVKFNSVAIQILVKELCKMLETSTIQKQIAAASLKSFLTLYDGAEIIASLISTLCKELNDNLDAFDILLQIFEKPIWNNQELQKSILDSLLPILYHPKGPFRRKSILCLAAFTKVSSKALLDSLVSSIMGLLEIQMSERNLEKIDSLVSLFAHISHLFHQSLPHILESTLKFLSIENEDLKEQCLGAIMVFCKHQVYPEIIERVLDASLYYIKYDPNYDETMELDDTDDEFGSEFENDSEDDDMSWKIRKQSSKLLESLIVNHGLEYRYDEIIQALQKSISDRHENVRLQSLAALATLIRNSNMELAIAKPHVLTSRNKITKRPKVDVKFLDYLPAIMETLVSLLAIRSESTTSAVFSALISIAAVSHESIIQKWKELMRPIGTIVNKLDSGFKILVLELFSQFLKTGATQIEGSQLEDILNVIDVTSVDIFYKVSQESLNLSCLFVQSSRPITNHMVTVDGESIHRLQRLSEIVLKSIQNPEVTIEVKETALQAIGTLLFHCKDILHGDYLVRVMPFFQFSISSDTLRMAALKAITEAIESPLGISDFKELSHDIIPLMLQSHHQTRVLALKCISSFISHKLISDLSEIISNISRIFLAEADLVLTPVLECSMVALKNLKDYQIWNSIAFPALVKLIIHSPSLISNSGDSMYQLWGFMSSISDQIPVFQSLQEIIQSVKNSEPKESALAIAKVVSASCLGSIKNSSALIKECFSEIQSSNSDSMINLSLLILGEVSAFADIEEHGNANVIVKNFEHRNVAVKKSAAYSLGKLVQNNPKKYLSNLLSSVASKNMEFLYLLSLKEFLMGSKFGSYTTDEVWDLLQSVAKGDLEEGNLNIVSECFCRISIQSSGHYEKLQQLIHNENAKLRVVAMGAIKYAFGMNVDLDDNAVMPFFALLNDPELLVRRAALSALHAVVHFRPELIAGHLDAVLPILYSQTIYNESLVKTVQFGPMQHKIDSGLDARKIAFQVVLLLLEKNLAGPNADFVQAVVNGISDPDHDISTISLKIVVKMCKLEHLMSHYMSGIVLEIEKTIDKQKPKLDNQKLQGQDRERAKELILFCLATLLTFDKLQPIPAILSKYEKEHKLMHEARELEQAQIK